MAAADGLLFLGAMTLLFRKEGACLDGETERISGKGKKARMAAACSGTTFLRGPCCFFSGSF